jgi:hypothetical protein
MSRPTSRGCSTPSRPMAAEFLGKLYETGRVAATFDGGFSMMPSAASRHMAAAIPASKMDGRVTACLLEPDNEIQ